MRILNVIYIENRNLYITKTCLTKNMFRFSTKVLHRKIREMEEFDWPKPGCSLFLMTDGRMYGERKLFAHHEILEELLGRKIDDSRMFANIIKKANVSRVLVSGYNGLFVNLVDYPTREQKQTVLDLIKYGKYVSLTIHSLRKFNPDEPKKDDILNALGIYKFYCNRDAYMAANDFSTIH